jgi:NAD(P)H-hydrate epimerase
MKLLTAQQMREIDRSASSDYHIPSIVLMENAGIKTVDAIYDLLAVQRGNTVVILAGKGNNGGDGLVAARHLINNGINVDIFLMGNPEEMTTDTYTNYKILVKMSTRIYPLLEEKDLNQLMLSLLESDLIVDAIYGTGFKGILDSFNSRVVKLVNSCKSPVVAVDIPSGVEADTGKVHGEAIKASRTVTFALPKIGLVFEPGKDYTGTLTVADITIPKQLLEDDNLKTNLITETMVHPFIKPRKPESHKGTYGHGLVIGGSAGMTGAVMMSGSAALKTGAGLVTAAVPKSLLPVVETGLLEVMTIPLPETRQAAISLEALPVIESLLGRVSVCAIGPGMSSYPEANAILRFVLERAGIPVIIDADGINALQGDPEILRNRQVPVVLTPHPGEMARLLGKGIQEIQANRMVIAREFAQEYGVTLVLKGNKTLVAAPSGAIYVNMTGNPGMATAGSGDVLCGLITGLIAQGIKPQDAAIVGVYVHGLAGDCASKIKGQRGLIAGDLIDSIPDILKQFENT